VSSSTVFYCIISLFLLSTPPSVESPVLQDSDPQEWRISTRPTVEIGSTARAGPDLWSAVVGMVKVPGGNITVLDGGRRAVEVFLPNGTHVSSAGGRGEGPGEFRTMRPPMSCGGDSVVVWDPSLRRSSLFDGAGTFVRQFRLTRPPGGEQTWLPWKVVCNRSGIYVTTLRDIGGFPTAEGPTRIDFRLEIGQETGPIVTLGPFPGSEFYLTDGSMAPRPLGKETLVAVDTDRVFIGTGDAFEIDVYSLNGEKISTIRDDFEPTDLTDAVLDGYVSDRISSGRRSPESVRRFYARLEYSEHLPAYSKLLVDLAGNLWVQEYPVPGEEGTVWRVFDKDGHRVTVVQMPSSFDAFQIGEDFVLGVGEDGSGVQFVRQYSLIKK